MAIDWFWVGLALGIPWLAGALWVRGLWRTAPPGRWPLALGYGYLLGLLATALLLRAQAAASLPMDFVNPLIILLLLALAGGGLTGWRNRSHFPAVAKDRNWNGQEMQQPAPGWQLILFILLLAWLGWRFFILAQEIGWRPLYPWDAWTTWLVPAKVWSELQQWVQFVDPQQWLADTRGSVYTIEAWHYPQAITLLALWPTLAFGNWNESIAHLPWLGAALALGLGFYGQARLWGATPLSALIFVWLLLSLPMLDTHVALAGYADLWLATVFGLAACAFLQWARTRDWRQGLLALLLALACPWIKHEGLVWASILLPAALWVWTPRRYWPWLSGGVIVLLIVWFVADGFVFSVAGLGEIRLTPEVIELPPLGRFELHYHDVWGPVVRNLLLLGNWHLLGYLLLAALLIGLPAVIAEPWRLAGLVLVLSGLLVLFILFFFTDAHHWARQYTSFNRVFLHFTPALLFWILTMFVTPCVMPTPAPVDTHP